MATLAEELNLRCAKPHVHKGSVCLTPTCATYRDWLSKLKAYLDPHPGGKEFGYVPFAETDSERVWYSESTRAWYDESEGPV